LLSDTPATTFHRGPRPKSSSDLTPRSLRWILTALFAVFPVAHAAEKPLLRDFMGINGHYHFRPTLYRPVCRLVRNYHPMVWDIGPAGAKPPELPRARQVIEGSSPVEWDGLYRSWKAEGFQIDASLQFESIPPSAWRNRDAALFVYGEAFARTFGPSSTDLVEAAEIGNEPAEYDETTYREVFQNLAQGLRAGDPKLKIVTAAVMAEAPDKYSKNLQLLKDLAPLFDVISVHSYSLIEGWPTWRRVHPEHPDIPYLTTIRKVLAWRNQHAPDKEVWVTEFGYDASSQAPPPDGPMAQWVGASETEQAQWIVRSFLLFSALGLDRAYVYFYNDEDVPGFHSASGLTRNFAPKPAYWAMRHLYRTLGSSRFHRVVSEKPGDLFIYEFHDPLQPETVIWVAWSPTGSQHSAKRTLEIPGRVTNAERMSLTDAAEPVEFTASAGRITVEISESPLYLTIRRP
jgi:serine/threonine-protein kinase ATR